MNISPSARHLKSEDLSLSSEESNLSRESAEEEAENEECVDSELNKKLMISNIDDILLKDYEGNEYKLDHFYKIGKFLGAGGFGYVISARDRSTGREMALKVNIIREY